MSDCHRFDLSVGFVRVGFLMCSTSWDANLDNHAHPAFHSYNLPLLAHPACSSYYLPLVNGMMILGLEC